MISLLSYHTNFLTVLIPSRPVWLNESYWALSPATLITRDYLSKKILESLRNPNVAKRYPYLTNGFKEWGQYEIEWPEYDPVNQTYFNLSKSRYHATHALKHENTGQQIFTLKVFVGVNALSSHD